MPCGVPAICGARYIALRKAMLEAAFLWARFVNYYTTSCVFLQSFFLDISRQFKRRKRYHEAKAAQQVAGILRNKGCCLGGYFLPAPPKRIAKMRVAYTFSGVKKNVPVGGVQNSKDYGTMAVLQDIFRK